LPSYGLGRFRSQEALFQRRKSENKKPDRGSTSVRLFFVWCQAPWYETLVLEMEFTPEGDPVPETAHIHTIASLREDKSTYDEIHLASAKVRVGEAS
jgi:hypothetical protein